MKTFKSYITETVTDNEKLIKKLEKTRSSMHTHWKGGGEARHQRGRELIYRYEGLANKLKDNEGGRNHWRAYCNKHKYSHDHEGHDFYA